MKKFQKIASLLFLLISATLAFAQPAKRVVSLAPSITENLYLIGAQNLLAGCTSYCDVAVADGKAVVGSTIDINAEKIFSLKPDLVLAMELTKPQDIQTLKKLGIRVEIIPTPDDFEEICEQALYLGKLTGTEQKATEVIGEIRKKVYEIKQLSSGKTKKQKVFFQIGANPIFSVLENTFMNDFMLFTNSENIANGLKRGTLNRESVLVKNPDVIIIASMGGFGKEEMQVWKNYPEINAVKNNRVFLIPSETSCSPTPSNFLSALTDVYQFLNR